MVLLQPRDLLLLKTPRGTATERVEKKAMLVAKQAEALAAAAAAAVVAESEKKLQRMHTYLFSLQQPRKA
jgi:hypothetical protein